MVGWPSNRTARAPSLEQAPRTRTPTTAEEHRDVARPPGPPPQRTPRLGGDPKAHADARPSVRGADVHARRQCADQPETEPEAGAVGPRADADAVILDAHAQQAIGGAFRADADRSRAF